MGIVTTYVCDVSGVTGPKEDFVEVKISAIPTGANHWQGITVTKQVHKDVALKLHLLKVMPEVSPPEPTFESKLGALLKDYIQGIAYEAGEEAASNAISNRN